MRKISIDDGFNPELARGAKFIGIFDMPVIEEPDSVIIPNRMIPFSQRQKVDHDGVFLAEYEHDVNFAELISSPQDMIREIREKFAGIISPDNSLYFDSPLTVQIANVYRNRLIASFLQRHGVYTIANVRWGDERSYTKRLFPEPFAFEGVPKNSIVAVGAYGSVKDEQTRFHFMMGFREMVRYLNPKVILIYGKLPQQLKNEFRDRIELYQYNDWISIKHGARVDGYRLF